MRPDPELVDALRRAGLRFAYHLARAGAETLKAIESVIDELGGLADGEETAVDKPRRQRIDLE